MSAPEVVVVGCCTDTTARVFVAAESDLPQPHVTMTYSADGGAATPVTLPMQQAQPFWIVNFELSGLPPGAAVEYMLDVGGNPDPPPAPIPANPLRFRLLPPERPLRIALVSCNGPEEIKDSAEWHARWRALGDAVENGEVDLVVHAGDQVYADDILKGFNSMPTAHDPSAADEHYLTGQYRRCYYDKWKHPDVQRVLAGCPALMMWDDHEIFDGYGSLRGSPTPAMRACYSAAKRAFQEFQLSHGPMPIDPGNSFAGGFIHNGVGILLIDGRSQRNYAAGCIVGPRQWSAIDRWLEEVGRQELRRLFVVVGVPPVHSKVLAAEWLMKKTGARPGDLDDIRDSWVSKKNFEEGRRLMLRLFNFRARNPATEVVILGGDVHVGTLAEIESRMNAHEIGGRPATILQITASGIGRPPPPGIVMFLLQFTQGTIHFTLNRDIRGRLLPIQSLDERPRVLASRNFAVLIQDEDEEWEPHGNLVVRFSTDQFGEVSQTFLGSQEW